MPHTAAGARRPAVASFDYVRLLETYSDHAVLEADRSRRLFDAIATAIDRRGGRIELPQLATLHLARVL